MWGLRPWERLPQAAWTSGASADASDLRAGQEGPLSGAVLVTGALSAPVTASREALVVWGGVAGR